MRALKYFASFAVGLVLCFSIVERRWGAVIVSKALGCLAFGGIAEDEPDASDGEAG